MFKCTTLLFILSISCLIFIVVNLIGSAAASTARMSKMSARQRNDELDWWQYMVLYQIYPRSFKDSDGDGIGDIQGVISKLPYLAETGINAIWMSPVCKSPMIDFGYDVSDFKDIQKEYGTMADFEQLIQEATKLGIKVIFDFVPNHTSDQHEWFEKSVNRVPGFEDFYVWVDAKIDKATGKREPPTNWRSVFYGTAWQWHEKRQQYYLHQFAVEQPDLNYRNPNVLKAIDDVLYFWLDKGVSGFRIDAIHHIFESEELIDEPASGLTNDKEAYEYTTHEYTRDLPDNWAVIQHWRTLLENYKKTHGGHTRIVVSESYSPHKIIANYYETSDGKKGAHFPFNFDFINDMDKTSDARDFVFILQRWLTYMPRDGTANWVLGNHDRPRIGTRFCVDMIDAFNMMIMTLPGVACTYYGEEIGMEDCDISFENTIDPAGRALGPKKYREKSRDPVRTPFQWDDTANAGFSTTTNKTWLPVNPNYKINNLKQQKEAENSHYKVYKALIELRKILPTLQKGRTQLEVINRSVFLIKRELNGQATVITIINVSGQLQSVDISDIVPDTTHILTVLVSGINSKYEIGHELPKLGLKIEAHEGIVCAFE